jgi:hypothetical protein
VRYRWRLSPPFGLQGFIETPTSTPGDKAPRVEASRLELPCRLASRYSPGSGDRTLFLEKSKEDICAKLSGLIVFCEKPACSNRREFLSAFRLECFLTGVHAKVSCRGFGFNARARTTRFGFGFPQLEDLRTIPTNRETEHCAATLRFFV